MTDMGSWKRLCRRWITILSAMLCGNLFLIVLAVAGFGGAPQSAGEVGEAAVVTSQFANTEPAMSEAQPTETAEVAAKAVPDPALPELGQVESLVQIDPQPKPLSEQDQPSAPETAKVNGDDTVPVAQDEARSDAVVDQELVIANPRTTGGTVHFVVEGEVYSLLAGTYRRFPGTDPKRVIFHKGDDEADAQHELETGLFAFAVGSAGWELVPVDPENSQKVLRGCDLAAE